MSKLSHLFAISAVLFVGAGVATAAPADFIGDWRSANPETRGIVRTVVTSSGSGLSVQVFGACSPSPCNWGVVPLRTYGSNVSDGDHKFGGANYDKGFARTSLTFHLLSWNQMEVRSYTEFTDGSGRQSYASRELLVRSPAGFVGSWRSADPATRGIVRTVIAPSGSGLSVQVFGACSPSPCNWGSVPLATYGSNVSDDNHTLGRATYNHGFARRTLTFELLSSNRMQISSYTEFTDGSGRQPYRLTEILDRE
jgi:hypothetical protein